MSLPGQTHVIELEMKNMFPKKQYNIQNTILKRREDEKVNSCPYRLPPTERHENVSFEVNNFTHFELLRFPSTGVASPKTVSRRIRFRYLTVENAISRESWPNELSIQT